MTGRTDMRAAFPVSASTDAFIRALPKTEVHLHIEGALPWDLLRSVAPERYDGSLASWLPGFRFPDFGTFERQLIAMASAWFISPDRYHRAAEIVFGRLMREQGVRYVETSFASGVVEFAGLDGAAVAQAIRTAAPPGLEVRVFMGIHHDGYHDGTASWLEASIGWKHLDGLDLHGPETAPLGPWAARLWSRARDAGLVTKAHAGEFDGPAFVRRVMDELGVARIQHGVRCLEDPSLVAEIAARGIVLDVCPISNVKLGVVPGYDRHPIRSLIEQGVRCTVSTDDPLVFGQTLRDEYAMLSSRLGFSHQELAEIAATGFRNALVGPDWIQERITEIEETLSRYST